MFHLQMLEVIWSTEHRYKASLTDSLTYSSSCLLEKQSATEEFVFSLLYLCNIEQSHIHFDIRSHLACVPQSEAEQWELLDRLPEVWSRMIWPNIKILKVFNDGDFENSNVQTAPWERCIQKQACIKRLFCFVFC